jgi:cobalt-zinc-cadmium efflux system membrane fusion protein
MHPRIKNLLARASSQAPTALVLAALAGLACWGYAQNWKAPKLAALWGPPDEGEKKERTAKGEEAPTSDDSGAGAGQLPPVKLDSPGAAEKAGIHCKPAEERAMDRCVTANGVLAFNEHRHVRLSTRAFGTAWSVEKHEGDPVKKGDVLGIVAAGEVGKAKAELLQALVQFGVKSKNLERVRAAADSMPDREIRAAEAAVREARATLLGAHQALLNLGLPIRLEDLTGLSDEQVVRKLRLLGLPREVIDRVDPATLTANLLPLTSPLDGLVIDHVMAVGEVLDPVRTQHQFIVADVSTLWLMLDVRLEDVGHLALGQEVTFHSDATGQTATGKLAWISAEVDPKTRTVRARADIANPDGRLRPATFGTAQVLVGRKPRAVAVPDGAVQFDGRRNVQAHLVFVRVSGDVFQPRVVRRGVQAGGFTEIVSGVRPGENVVTEGSHVLKSEMLKHLIASEE